MQSKTMGINSRRAWVIKACKWLFKRFTSDAFSNVHAFNKLVIKVPDRELDLMPKEEREWIVEALCEELTELQEAIEHTDLVKLVDALIDISYYALGGLTRCGFTDDESRDLFNIVHTSNMLKILGQRDNRSTRIKHDAIKPAEWIDPKLRIINYILEAKRRRNEL